ncbi:MAG: hypothetical protein AAGA77_25530 [Bacteroidota bacterium]
MNKLSIADLEKRSESVASQELLNTIAGGASKSGAFDSCHNDSCHDAPADIVA